MKLIKIIQINDYRVENFLSINGEIFNPIRKNDSVIQIKLLRQQQKDTIKYYKNIQPELKQICRIYKNLHNELKKHYKGDPDNFTIKHYNKEIDKIVHFYHKNKIQYYDAAKSGQYENYIRNRLELNELIKEFCLKKHLFREGTNIQLIERKVRQFLKYLR